MRLLFSFLLVSSISFGIGYRGNVFEVGALEFASVSVAVTADDQVIDVSTAGLVKLTSDGIPVSRTIILTEPKDKANRFLILSFKGGAGQGIQLIDDGAIDSSSGFVRLSNNFGPTANQSTITLHYDGLDWVEIARSIN